MVLDSLGLLCALALFAATIGAWRLSGALPAGSRLYLRFAAMLFAGLAVSFPLGLSGAVSLFLLPLAAAALMIASLARSAAPLPVSAASLALITGLCGGLAAMLWGGAMLAAGPAMAASLAIAAVALNSIALIPVLAGTALLASVLVFLEAGAPSAMLLFLAAALVGLANPTGREKSALAVQQ